MTMSKQDVLFYCFKVQEMSRQDVLFYCCRVQEIMLDNQKEAGRIPRTVDCELTCDLGQTSFTGSGLPCTFVWSFIWSVGCALFQTTNLGPVWECCCGTFCHYGTFCH